MARPVIEIPEATCSQVSQLRAEGKTLKQISTKTGLKYHLVRRVLEAAGAQMQTATFSGQQNQPGSSMRPEIDPHGQSPMNTLDNNQATKTSGKDFHNGLKIDSERRLSFRGGGSRGFWDNKLREARAMREYQYLMSDEYTKIEASRNQAEHWRLLREEAKAMREYLSLFVPKQDTRILYEYSEAKYQENMVELIKTAAEEGCPVVDLTKYLLERVPLAKLFALKRVAS